MSSCFYSQPNCCSNLSREHVISAALLRTVFGTPIHNVVSGDFLGTKTLVDHEPVVRDVCERCNNEALSPYDESGLELVRRLMEGHDPTGVRLPLSRNILGWLIKTHLNYIRVIKDRKSNDIYPIAQGIKSGLIQHTELPTSLFRLLIEGWVGEPYFWDAGDSRHVPWFNYRSVRFVSQRIVISDLRLKTLTTWIVIPSNANYDGFDCRVASVLDEVRRDLGCQLQPVDVKKAIDCGYIDLEHVLSLDEVKRFIMPVGR